MRFRYVSELRVAQVLDDLQNSQNDLAAYNSQLVSLQTQPERVQNAMYTASQQIQQIRNRLDGNNVGEAALRPSQQVLLQAQQALLNAQIDQQRKSLEGNTVLQDTPAKQRDYVTANSNRLEHQLQLLQEAVNSKRLTLTEKRPGEAISPDETARIRANPLVKQELDINHQLSQRLIVATENGNMLMQQNIKVKLARSRAAVGKKYQRTDCRLKRQPVAVAYSLSTAANSALRRRTRRYDQPHCGFASGAV